jgi:tetratricopeptide (TPR) repeat protein
MSDLTSAFDQFKSLKLDVTFLEGLAKLGYRYDLTSQYISEGILDDALDYYRRGAVAREKVVGPNHSLTRRAKHILIHMLMKKGELGEAWEVAVTLTKLDDLSLADSIAVNATMSQLWMELGDTVQAEATIRYLLDWFAEGPESDHTERLDHQQDLVKLLLQRDECNEALELALKTVEECSRELGSGHSTTRGAKRCLAASYDALGQFQMGVEVNKDLTRQDHQASSGEEIKPVLVQDIARLGIEYYLLGRKDAAKECYERIQNAVEQNNEMAVYAVNAVNNCATRLLNRGNLERAATILEALLLESTRVLGVESQETALVMGNLAYIYDSEMQWDKSEKLERQVIQIRRLILGEKHRDTITAMGGLRQTLVAQKRYKEAADIAREEYACFRDTSREEKINAAETLARALEAAGAFAEAIPFFEEELALKTAEGENLPLAVVSAMIPAAICHMELGQLSRARNLVDETVMRVRDAKELNEDSTTIAAEIVRLTKVCLEKDCIAEGEKLLSVVAGRFRQLLEEGDLKAQFESVSLELATRTGQLQI